MVADAADAVDLLDAKTAGEAAVAATRAPGKPDNKSGPWVAGREHETEPAAGELEQRALDTETMRLRICRQVKEDITPLVTPWGVDIIAFAESSVLADKAYQGQYEKATLDVATAKARLRSNAALNQVNVQQARADAQAARIRAEGEKNARIIEAQGRATATELDADARQKAAQSLSSPFGQQVRLIEANAALVGGIKAQTLVLGDAASQKILPVLNLAPQTPIISRS